MELLAAIAIVAVLGGIVLVGVAKVRASAQRTQCLSNLREVSRGLLLFAADNRGRFPALFLGSKYGNKGPWSQQLVDTGYLSPPPHVLTCPTDEEALKHTATAATATTDYNRKNVGRSYAYAWPAMQPVSGEANRHSPLLVNQVGNPASTFMLVEFRQSTAQDYRWINGCFVGRDIANPNKTQPHGSRMNLSYLDGHVAALPPAEAAKPEHWVIQ